LNKVQFIEYKFTSLVQKSISLHKENINIVIFILSEIPYEYEQSFKKYLGFI